LKADLRSGAPQRIRYCAFNRCFFTHGLAETALQKRLRDAKKGKNHGLCNLILEFVRKVLYNYRTAAKAA